MRKKKEVHIIRELACRVMEAANEPVQDERRRLWRSFHDLQPERPMLYIDISMPRQECIGEQLCCGDPFYREYEALMREELFHAEVGDDYVVEPWITMPARYIVPEGGHWGIRAEHIRPPDSGGAWRTINPLREPDDVEKMIVPEHKIDEEATAISHERLCNAIGDILPVNLSRKPFMSVWGSHISGDLGELRGIETMMMDMLDQPEWLHTLLARLRDGILKVHREAEEAGDWSLGDHINQAVPYGGGLPDPAPASNPAPMKQLWCLMAAQEMTLCSPEMHDEFMLQYQLPICELFGQVHYGCCEDLTRKIDILRQLPNLRRIAVSPWANVRSCAEQIGKDYCASWRPNPAQAVCCGFHEDELRQTIREGLALFASHNCPVEINLKDVKTLQGEPERLAEFARVCQEEICVIAG